MVLQLEAICEDKNCEPRALACLLLCKYIVIGCKGKKSCKSQECNLLQAIEKENVMLRQKLSDLRDELSEATKHITEMTGELRGLKHTCQEQQGNVGTPQFNINYIFAC